MAELICEKSGFPVQESYFKLHIDHKQNVVNIIKYPPRSAILKLSNISNESINVQEGIGIPDVLLGMMGKWIQ